MAVDPISLTGLLASAVATIAMSIHRCNELMSKCQDVPRGLLLIRTESKTVKLALDHVYWLSSRDETTLASRLGSESPFADTFDTVLTGCRTTFALLDQRLSDMTNLENIEGKSTWTDRIRFLWDESAIRGLIDQMRGLHSAVSILLNVLQTESLANIRELLYAGRPVLESVRRQSLSVDQVSNQTSLDPRYSKCSDLGANCRESESDFHHVLFNSSVYRKTLISSLRDRHPHAPDTPENEPPGEGDEEEEPLIDLASSSNPQPKEALPEAYVRDDLLGLKLNTEPVGHSSPGGTQSILSPIDGDSADLVHVISYSPRAYALEDASFKKPGDAKDGDQPDVTDWPLTTGPSLHSTRGHDINAESNVSEEKDMTCQHRNLYPSACNPGLANIQYFKSEWDVSSSESSLIDVEVDMKSKCSGDQADGIPQIYVSKNPLSKQCSWMSWESFRYEVNATCSASRRSLISISYQHLKLREVAKDMLKDVSLESDPPFGTVRRRGFRINSSLSYDIALAKLKRPLKIVLIGDPLSGKSYAIESCIERRRSSSDIPTLLETFKLHSNIYRGNRSFPLEVEIIDTPGTDGFMGTRHTLYENADLFLACFRITDCRSSLGTSLMNVHEQWLPEIRESRGCTTPFALVGLQHMVETTPAGQPYYDLTYSMGLKAAKDWDALAYLEGNAFQACLDTLFDAAIALAIGIRLDDMRTLAAKPSSWKKGLFRYLRKHPIAYDT